MTAGIFDYVFWSAIVNLAVWSLLMFVSITYLRCPMYHPFFVYMIYHFIGFIIRPFNIYITSYSYLWERIGFSPSYSDILLITLVSNVAILSVFAGMVLARKSRTIPPLVVPQLKISRKKIFFITLVVLASIGMFATIKNIGDSSQVLSYDVVLDDKGGQRLDGVSGYFTSLALFMPGILIFLFLNDSTRKFSLICIVAFIGVRLFAGANRTSFVVVLLGVFLYFYALRGRIYASPLLLIPATALAVVFEIIGNDRLALRLLLDGSKSFSDIVTDYLERRGSSIGSNDSQEYDVATAAISYITKYSDYSFGTQYLRLIIWPIPRQIWEDKPVFTSILDLNKYGNFQYLTITNYADTYSVLSFPAMIIACLILGMVFSKMYNMALNTKSAVAFTFYWIFVVYEFLILRDGGVTVVIFWVFAILPIFILIKLGKVKMIRPISIARA